MIVFFDARQAVPGLEAYSPSSSKPTAVLESWKDSGLHVDVRSFDPTSEHDLTLAHDPEHVHSILVGSKANGFGNRDPRVAASLLWTTGSMTAAALHVLEHGGAATSPTSGFHHARYRQAFGFCTFNGLIVAAQRLRQAGCSRVGILDLDFHFGDGTDEIIGHLGLDYIQHYSVGQHDIEAGEAATRWLAGLPDITREFSSCDVVLYQAGADPWIGDPLGGNLTREQLRCRDAIVFSTLAELRVPVAWNLAGGYARDDAGTIRPVLDIHDATGQECIRVYDAK